MSKFLKNMEKIIAELGGEKPVKIIKEGFKNIALDVVEKGTEVIKESVTLFTEEASEVIKNTVKVTKEGGKKKKPERKLKVVKNEEE
jgi:hypothetical protein